MYLGITFISQITIVTPPWSFAPSASIHAALLARALHIP